jgi:DNA ligase-1
MLSPKLDGIRALGVPGLGFVSRNLKPIPNKRIRDSIGELATKFCLDGELIAGDPRAPDCYRRTMSIVMSEEHPDWESVRFWPFDVIDLPRHEYTERHQVMIDRVESYVDWPRLFMPLLHSDVDNPDQLLEQEHAYVSEGYEGVMLRHPRGLYKNGRSTVKEGWLLKLKRFADAEGEVVGVVEYLHNDNPLETDNLGYAKRSSHKANRRPAGKLGALVVRAAGWRVEFTVGTGFTETDRVRLWAEREALMGRFVRFRFFPAGSKEAPRFPTFAGFRHPDDL